MALVTRLPQLLPALAGGLAIGVFYFAGLWWTVRRLPDAGHPALMSLGSLMVRTGIALLGFYVIMGGQFDRLLAALSGFLIVRFVMVRRLKPEKARTPVS